VTGPVLWRIARWVLLLAFAAFFLLPLVALLDFSTKVPGTGVRTGDSWRALTQDPTMTEAITTSLLLALLTVVGMVVLLVPTMIWVRLRVPAASRLVEFLCLLPLTIPALVIVVGLKNVYAWVNYLVGDSPLTLAFVYVVLVLPYSYRAIDAALSGLDVRTVSVALVLGEYTVSSLLHYDTLPVVIVLLGKSDAPESMAAALASILFVSLLLVALSFLDRRRRTSEGK